ncbi:6036_t:CDS:2 [Acaulospora colombiana]|uniref:6036_t:CDS:1 n=1 Tax=Acaulospora colombiana TaxID=27376 RepID=A0ACA9N3A5_9GLOM|nr:6036_t:CDS:2 [Acaulospora colombiana]
MAWLAEALPCFHVCRYPLANRGRSSPLGLELISYGLEISTDYQRVNTLLCLILQILEFCVGSVEFTMAAAFNCDLLWPSKLRIVSDWMDYEAWMKSNFHNRARYDFRLLEELFRYKVEWSLTRNMNDHANTNSTTTMRSKLTLGVTIFINTKLETNME